MASAQTVGDFPVKSKILLITGGGSGTGLAFAKLFNPKDGRVIIGDLELTAAAEDFLHTTEVDSPGSVVFGTCDVMDWNSLHALISASVQEFSELPDVYRPCAGIFEPPWSNFWVDTEGYATTRINREHPIKLTRLAIRALRGGGDKKGVVLTVASSGSGLIGTLYCTSKHAIVGLMESLGHVDAAEGVKVVCICPTIVATPLWEDREDDRAKDYKYGEEGSARDTPEEVANAMLRLVEEGKYAGGTVLRKTQAEEHIAIEGGPSTYDLSWPTPILAKERGKNEEPTFECRHVTSTICLRAVAREDLFTCT
ncbi:unnamed protein product [Discula destructiva]